MHWLTSWLIAVQIWGTGMCAQSAADFYVESLPDVAPDAYFPEMHAGTLEVSEHSALFFWHVASQFQVSKPRTVFWLNGGPGCSSMDGALMEIGPFRFSEDGSQLIENVDSWNKYANLLFLDQPLGTGYSKAEEKIASNDLSTISENVVLFLQKYFEVFPEQKSHEIYIAGESYAGQYIPYIYKAIKDTDPSIKVAGLLLDNPWIDPAHQYPSYISFLFKHELITADQDTRTLLQLHQACIEELKGLDVVLSDNAVCNRISDYALQHFDDRKTCFNVYNIELTDTYSSCGMNWPPGVEFMSSYLSRSDVRRAFNVAEDGRWTECSTSVSASFRDSKSPAAVSLLPEILEEIPVLLLVGELDYICNIIGLRSMVDNLQWGGRTGLHDTTESRLVIRDTDVGTIASARNLTFVGLTKGSHMTPFELPYETRSIMYGFSGIAPTYNTSMEFDAPPTKQEKDKIVSDAMYRAYYQAGFVALGVVGGVLLIVALVSWRTGAKSSFTLRGLMNALLHAAPRKNKPLGEYVNLQTFRRFGRPATIHEEDEEEDDNLP